MEVRPQDSSTIKRQCISYVADGMTDERLRTQSKAIITPEQLQAKYLNILPLRRARWKDLEATQFVVQERLEWDELTTQNIV